MRKPKATKVSGSEYTAEQLRKMGLTDDQIEAASREHDAMQRIAIELQKLKGGQFTMFDLMFVKSNIEKELPNLTVVPENRAQVMSKLEIIAEQQRRFIEAASKEIVLLPRSKKSKRTKKEDE